jgi:PAS domain S-box-containing protein
MWRRSRVAADDLMGLLGLIVFKRDKHGRFRRVSPLPPWVADFALPGKPVDDARDLPFIFLGVFLDACDEAIRSEPIVPEMDEVWHERDRHDNERGFRVQLVDMGGIWHLVLRCEDAGFAEQQGLFQRAREQKLALDALAKTEAALRESQQHLDLMMRQAPAMFWCADVDGMITYCSGSACDAFDCGGKDLLAESVTILFRDADIPRDLILSAHEIAMAGESATFVVSSGGRTFDVRVEPLYDADKSRAVGTIGVGVESTERVKAEAEAAAALQAKTDFVTGISHEIRTPMNAIIGLTELALDLPLTSEQQAYLQSSISSAESLLGVIDQLLDFSKIEQGESILDSEEFSLPDLITDVLSGLAVHAHGKGVELISIR